MTPVREAIVLPAIFLTVTLLGGFRLADAVRFVPPSLSGLVLGVLLLGTLARGQVFLPHALLHGSRTAAGNLSGGIVLLTAFAATTQAVNLLLPDRGLLHAALAVFLFCQLLTMNAARTDRAGMLRSLLVLLGSLFVLRHIVIEALYAPGGGLLHRVLTTLLAGATLGGIAYEPNAPLTGYVAFCTLLLYTIGLLLLPAGQPSSLPVRSDRSGSGLPSVLPLVLLLLAAGCGGPAGAGREPGGVDGAAAAATGWTLHA